MDQLRVVVFFFERDKNMPFSCDVVFVTDLGEALESFIHSRSVHYKSSKVQVGQVKEAKDGHLSFLGSLVDITEI